MTYVDAPPSRRGAPPSPQACAVHSDLPTNSTAWEGWEGDCALGKPGKPHLGQGVKVTITETGHVDGRCP